MKRISILLISTLLLQACGNSTSTESSTEAETETVAEEQPTFDNVPDHAEDEMGMPYEEYIATYKDENYTLKEGQKDGVFIIKNIEDGAYPQSTLHAEKEGETKAYAFDLMLEGGFTGLSSQDLYSAAAEHQQVYIAYEAEVLNYPQGVFEADKAKVGKDDMSVKGKMIIRSEDMGGDLPGHYYVEQTDGTSITFTDFWEEDLLKMNGKEVIVVYYTHERMSLKYINTIK